VAKQQPERRFTLLYDKVYRQDILQEAWQRVKSNKGAAGVDEVAIDEIREYGEVRFLSEIAQELRDGSYRVSLVRRVHIPKPGQPGKTRPLGIPTVKDRVIQMAVKLVIEPLFEADFVPCSFGFRPEKTPRMALSIIAEKTQAGYTHVVDVDLKSYFDTISHELLLELVERRVGDVKVVRLIRAWLKAGVLEEGRVTHPDRGSPQGGVVSPLLSNIMLHEVDRQWCRGDGTMSHSVVLVRYADDRVLLARTEPEARQAWERLQNQFAALRLVVNQEKSRLTTVGEGFAFLGFEFRKPPRRLLYMWPRKKACQHIRDRVREVGRSFPSSASVGEVIRKLNPVLNGWCTYFRAGNSNRVFHAIDWAVLSELQLWLRRKHSTQLAVSSEALELSVPVQTLSAVSNGRESEPSAWLAAHAAGRRWSESWMRAIRTSSSMRGRWKRATTQRACALLYRSPWLSLASFPCLDDSTNHENGRQIAIC